VSQSVSAVGAPHQRLRRRRQAIRDYARRFDCNLVVLIDEFVDESITMLGHVTSTMDSRKDLHLLLRTPGGDGEVALRLARLARAAGRRFVVLVPDIAKSAGTIMALAADEIVMGPTSDLGPVDPQVLLHDGGVVAAKDIVAAVDDAVAAVGAMPDSLALHASLLRGLDATVVHAARSALQRAADLIRLAVSNCPGRSFEEIDSLCRRLVPLLIDDACSHRAAIGADEAAGVGLPVRALSFADEQWRRIWEIWRLYFAMGPISALAVYEGSRGRPEHSIPALLRETAAAQQTSRCRTASGEGER